MAEACISVGQDQFSCPICLDLLKDPVTIPCGHSYCMDCIKDFWDQDDQKGVHSCPLCRQTFTPRPVLGRNRMLIEVVEKLKKTELQAAPPAHCYAGPGDVDYGLSIEEKHFEVPGLKKHSLVKGSTQLQEICSHHDKLLKLFCCTDQQCICYLCTMDGHSGHAIVSAKVGRNEKQKYLGATQRTSHQRIQEREKRLQELRQAVWSLRRSAQIAVEHSERIFTLLIRSIERRRSEVKELIRAQEMAEGSRAERLLERLEKEIAELRRRDAELNQLSHTEDHIQFLQSFQSLCPPPGSENVISITVNPHFSFGDVEKSICELKERLEDFCKEELDKISGEMTKVRVILPSEPKTREEFLQHFCQLTLDPNTAYKHLFLFAENRGVTHTDKVQTYPAHPERFDKNLQVLCREGMTGRCYWEADWSGDWGVYIAVSYKGISRKGGGNGCRFGHNDQSWSLHCTPSTYCFRYNKAGTHIPAPSSSRIGVYLDHSAGILSFYRVSDRLMSLLHTVQTTFTQPLYPAFLVGSKSTVKLCQLIK